MEGEIYLTVTTRVSREREGEANAHLVGSHYQVFKERGISGMIKERRGYQQINTLKNQSFVVTIIKIQRSMYTLTC